MLHSCWVAGVSNRAPATTLENARRRAERVRQVELQLPNRAHCAILRVLLKTFSLFPNIPGNSSLCGCHYLSAAYNLVRG